MDPPCAAAISGLITNLNALINVENAAARPNEPVTGG